MLHCNPFDRWSCRIEIARCSIYNKIEGSNVARNPWVFDATMPCESLQVGAVTLFERLEGGWIFLQQIQTGVRCGTSQWIGWRYLVQDIN